MMNEETTNAITIFSPDGYFYRKEVRVRKVKKKSTERL
jgi:hypothetical protein